MPALTGGQGHESVRGTRLVAIHRCHPFISHTTHPMAGVTLRQGHAARLHIESIASLADSQTSRFVTTALHLEPSL